MQLQIESPHAELDGNIKNLVRSKFEHLAKRYKRVFWCDVVLGEEKSDIRNN